MKLPYYSIVNNQIEAGLLLLNGCMVCMPHTGTACRSPAACQQSCCLHDTPSNFSSHTDSMAYPIQSLQSGYRYIYLASEGKMASPKVPYIFVRISVGLHVTCTLHWCVFVYIYTLHVAMVTVVVYYVYMYYACHATEVV